MIDRADLLHLVVYQLVALAQEQQAKLLRIGERHSQRRTFALLPFFQSKSAGILSFGSRVQEKFILPEVAVRARLFHIFMTTLIVDYWVASPFSDSSA